MKERSTSFSASVLAYKDQRSNDIIVIQIRSNDVRTSIPAFLRFSITFSLLNANTHYNESKFVSWHSSPEQTLNGSKRSDV